ncbi:MAG: hypothetical protein P8X74_01960 [Reinekea sp.]
MAQRHQSVVTFKASQVTTFAIILTLVFAGVGLVMHPGAGYPWSEYFDAYLFRVIRFSIIQALLSAFLSIAIAIPFAVLLAAHPFRGQWIVKALLNLFFILPVLTIILGVVNAFSDWFNVFGLRGILIAHLYLNVPYAIRILWNRLSRQSETQLRVAQTLGIGLLQRTLWIQWPIILDTLRPVLVLIFLLCFSSFTVVLTLGGGPANSNLEVAIYQALKFDFDPRAGVLYAAFHALIAFSAMWLTSRRDSFSMDISSADQRRLAPIKPLPLAALVVLLIILAYPLLSLISAALMNQWQGSSRLVIALWTSFKIAVGSSLVATLLALLRALDEQPGRLRRMLDFGLLVLPIMVIATGLLLLALRLNIAFKITSWMIIWLNGLMALPLILGPLSSRIRSYRAYYQPLAQSLGMSGWHSLRCIYWPAVEHIIPWCFTFSIVLSIGDLGIAAMLGSAQFVTLPILIYQAMGSYQMVLASQLTVILLGICCVCLMLAEWLGEKNTHA